MTNTHIHVPERPYWDRDIYGSAMRNGVPVFSKIGRGPRGYKGDKGDTGSPGRDGIDGISPWVEFGTNAQGQPTLIVHDGTEPPPHVDLIAGANGRDGRSLAAIVSGTTVTIVDADDPTIVYGSVSLEPGTFDPEDLTPGDCVNIEAAITDSGNNLIWLDYSWDPSDDPDNSVQGVSALDVSDAYRMDGNTPKTVFDDMAAMQRGIVAVRFCRNGLDYCDQGDPSRHSFAFDPEEGLIFVTPQITMGSGKLEECTVSFCLAITMPEDAL